MQGAQAKCSATTTSPATTSTNAPLLTVASNDSRDLLDFVERSTRASNVPLFVEDARSVTPRETLLHATQFFGVIPLGRRQSVPELDRAAWFTLAAARAKILTGQRPFLDELEQFLAARAA